VRTTAELIVTFNYNTTELYMQSIAVRSSQPKNDQKERTRHENTFCWVFHSGRQTALLRVGCFHV